MNNQYEMSLKDVCALKKHMLTQLTQMQSTLNEVSSPVSEQPTNDMKTESLTRLHEEAYSKHFIAERLVERIQLTNEALTVLFHRTSDNDSDVDDTNEIQSTTQEVFDQQMSILKSLLPIRELVEEKLLTSHELRQENRELRYQNRCIMTTIRDSRQANGKMDTENRHRIVKAEKDLQTLQNHVIVQRNVFQALMIGSGLNWAQDEASLNSVVDLLRSQTLH